ncbi:MAG: FecR domain-containing protein [Sphingomonas sp.]|jgi:transmembrane sensor|uniref:FecR family protein n=1 Tax=Sphingomonas sp. TaxID=28214 RepID=UPI0035677F8F
MAIEGGNRAAAEIRREASAWIARMRGPDADRSRLEFERWRAASPQHRLLYAEMEDISRGARQLASSSVGREYRGLRERRPLFARPRFRLAVTGIAVLLVAGSATLLLHRPAPIGASTGSEQAIASATGQLRRLRLPDGSAVVLDTDSRIEVAFGTSARLVRLVRGRARFAVAAATGAPFMVEAGDRLILDRGTVFDVAVGRDGVKVSLLRGAVEIHDRVGGGRPGRMLARLAPGQLALSVGSDKMPVQAAPAGADRWVDGLLSYDGVRLADVVADIDRYSPHKLRLGDPALAGLRVTGVFRAVPIEGAAQALAAALGLHVAAADNGDLILSR